MDKIPVTVLTGFLGSGKTTLLNRILSEHHGQRIAVIENEFGEIGVDQELVINADEEVFEMNNGCICCTVRGDLIRILGKLAKRRDRFDRVVLETTGLANPGPVAQTFFVDEEIRAHYALDGIVTLVDARHIAPHLDGSEEAREQVAFADVLVVNKMDLVPASDLDALERRLRGMNAMARLHRAHMARVPLAEILGIGGFDLSRALEYKPAFLEPEYPFEWGGVYSLRAGAYELTLQDGPDPSIGIVLTPAAAGEFSDIRSAAEPILRLFAEPAVETRSGDILRPDSRHCELAATERGTKRWQVLVAEPGDYLLFTQHRPEEFDLELRDDAGERVAASRTHEFVPAHTHEDAVGSVSLEVEAPLHPDRFSAWLSRLLREKGTTLYRMKGFLNVAGVDERVVLQGVHMLVDHAVMGSWGDRPRRTQLVLIGRELDKEPLQAGLARCVA
jgi:G3E family GTPase